MCVKYFFRISGDFFSSSYLFKPCNYIINIIITIMSTNITIKSILEKSSGRIPSKEFERHDLSLFITLSDK